MEDTISRTSCDSAVDEFVLVNVEPKLQIAGDGGYRELERKLTEVLSDDAVVTNSCCSGNKMSEVKLCPDVSSDDAGSKSDSTAGQQSPVQPASEENSAGALKMNDTAISCKNINTHAVKAYGGLLLIEFKEKSCFIIDAEFLLVHLCRNFLYNHIVCLFIAHVQPFKTIQCDMVRLVASVWIMAYYYHIRIFNVFTVEVVGLRLYWKLPIQED